MVLLKWSNMTDESQAMVKKVGLISLVAVIMLAFVRMIIPWVLLGGVCYLAWRFFFKD